MSRNLHVVACVLVVAMLAIAIDAACVNNKKLLLIGSDDSSVYNGAKAMFVATGSFEAVDVIDPRNTVPSAALLSGYRAVAVWITTTAASFDRVAFGNVLSDYSASGCGVVVGNLAARPGTEILGRWNGQNNLLPITATLTNIGAETYSTAFADNTTFIMQGLTTATFSLTGNPGRFSPTSAVNFGYPVMRSNLAGNNPLIVVRESSGGRIAYLNWNFGLTGLYFSTSNPSYNAGQRRAAERSIMWTMNMYSLVAPAPASIPYGSNVAPSNTGGMATLSTLDTACTIGTVSFVDSAISYAACPASFVRSFTATGTTGTSCAGLIIKSTQTIQLTDNVPPVLTITDASTSCTGYASSTMFGVPTVSDNCYPAAPTATMVDHVMMDGSSCPTHVNRVWTATDACGNVGTATQTIALQDCVATLQVPADKAVSCTDSTDVSATGQATASNGCIGTTVVTYADAITAGACSSSYTIVRTWTATTPCGMTSTATQNIVVSDVAAVLQVPADKSLGCGESSLPAAAGQATATYGCGVATVTYADTTVNGVIARQWTATTPCGIASTGVQHISFSDTQAPVITAPADTSATCSAYALTTPTATATDNCDASVSVSVNSNNVFSQAGCLTSVSNVFTATDSTGNTASATQAVSITDVPAVLQLPSDTSVDCDKSNDPAVTGQATASYACAGSATVAYSDSHEAGNCPDSYVIVRTWTATTPCGTVSTGVQRISVQPTAPVLSVPANVQLSCAADQTPAATGQATASTACSGAAVVTYADAITAGACSSSYTIVRTWTATTPCGMTSTATQNIVVSDVAAVLQVPADKSLGCGESSLPAAAGQATATYGCGVATVTYADTTVDGVIARQWTATTPCGIVSTGVQHISFSDTQAPVITAPADSSATCSAYALTTPTATATDNCDASVSVSVNSNEVFNDAGCLTSVSNVFIAIDSTGNTASATQEVSITDVAAELQLPSDTSVGCDESVDPAVTGQATASYVCTGGATVDYSDSREDGDCADAYVIVRTWTATTPCGTVTTGVQRISVEQTSPVLSVPDNVEISCDADQTPATTGQATASAPACSGAVAVAFTDSSEAGDCASAYVISRVWTATTTCGTVTSATQLITVFDSEAPVVTAPAARSASCTAYGTTVTGAATAVDTCDSVLTITVSDVETANANQCVTSVVRTFRSVDSCGNTGIDTQLITVTDVTPELTVPVSMSVSCGASTNPAETGQATATYGCAGGVTVTYSDAIEAGACDNAYAIVRTWTATSACGTEVSATQRITVADVAAALTVPESTTVGCSASVDPTATGQATAAYVCDGVAAITYTDAVQAGPCANSHDIIRTWTATTPCGTVTSGVQRITVQDIAASLSTPAAATLTCHDSTAPSSSGQAVASYSCSGAAVVSYSDARDSSTCPNAYSMVRTFTATTPCHITSSVTQLITVSDVAPVVTAPANVAVRCDASVAPSSTGQATVAYSCSGTAAVTYTDSVTAGGCGNSYVIMRTWTARSPCGTVGTATQTITVSDAAAVLTVPADTSVSCDASSTPDATGQATATSACPGTPVVTYVDSVQAGSCFNTRVITRTWTATTPCGTKTTRTQRITVTQGAAHLSVPDDTSVTCSQSTYPLFTGWAFAWPSTCSGLAFVNYDDSIEAGSCANSFVIVRTWTATTLCGTKSTGIQRITVSDIPATLRVPSDISVRCDASTLPAFTGRATASTSCAGTAAVTYTDNVAAGSCANSYVIARTWTATTTCGTTSTGSQRITVTDVTPSLTIPSDITIRCDASSLPDVTGQATSSYTCSGAAAAITYADAIQSGSCSKSYTIVRTWTATTACGKFSSRVQRITVKDTQAPVLTVPADVYQGCSDSVDTGDATAVDNCDNNPSVTYRDSIQGGSCAFSYTIVRTWTATDSCGNKATALQRIVVSDKKAPDVVLTNTCMWPPNKKYVCWSDAEFVRASDNCGSLNRNFVGCTVTETDNSGVVRTISSSNTCVRLANRICVQSDRSGNSNGRLYTIRYDVSDSCSNVAHSTHTVAVPHDGEDTDDCIEPVSKRASRRLLSETAPENDLLILDADAFTAVPAMTGVRVAVVCAAVVLLAALAVAIALIVSRMLRCKREVESQV